MEATIYDSDDPNGILCYGERKYTLMRNPSMSFLYPLATATHLVPY